MTRQAFARHVITDIDIPLPSLGSEAPWDRPTQEVTLASGEVLEAPIELEIGPCQRR